jgi:hypothetical protein
MTRVVFALLVASSVSATEITLDLQAAYYVPNREGYEREAFAEPDYSPIGGNDAPDARRELGSTWGGAQGKASLSVAERFPFLVGDGPLFSGNRVEPSFAFELSPVSATGIGALTFQPIAFLELGTGAALGTGWNAGAFIGLGVNPEGNDAASEGTPFGGAVWRTWFSLNFRFDLAAVVPGEWNHVVFLAGSGIEYRACTGASDGEAWVWETEDDNFNGAVARLAGALGYRPPSMLDFIGITAESSEWLGAVRSYSPMDADGGWGSDFRSWRLGPLAVFSLGEKDSFRVTAQFARERDWSDATTRRRDFRTRDYEAAYWSFERLAISYAHRF